MKTFLVLAVVAATLTACFSRREIQVEMVDATLVRIDTVNRQTGYEKQLFIWRDPRNIEYRSFESMSKIYALGTIMTVLKPR